jgi:hypothetical protein
MIPRYFFVVLFFFMTTIGYGQTIISGRIQNMSNLNLQRGVNILIQAKKDSEIVAFAVSKQDGSFSLSVDSSLDSLWLIAKSLTIQKVEIKVSNATQFLEIKVEESELELSEFMLEGVKSPITQKKDTLSYEVDGFISQSDKFLIDVLRRLPGIEVNANGTINYKGEAIQKFYIEGLDLLEGRYNLATQNMPVDAVQSVEILENHQPIKMLDGVNFSSKSSLNIRLKKKNVLIGRGYLGAGFPGIWDAKVAPMIFNNEFQSIVSLGSNNAGITLSDEILDLGANAYQSNSVPINQWFRPSGNRMGSTQDNRFIFNKSVLASVNTIKKKSEDYQIKTAIDYSREDVNNSFLIQKAFFLEDGRLDIRESGLLDEIKDQLSLKVNLTKNSDTDYLYNQFSATYSNSRDRSDIVFQNQELVQEINSPDIFISNTFRKLIKLGSKILDLNSEAYFLTQTPSLLSRPPFLGFNQDSLLQGALSIQRIRFNTYHFDNSLLYNNLRVFNMKGVASLGFLVKNSALKSSTFFGDSPVGFPFQNNLMLSEITGTSSFSIEKNTQKIKTKFSLPLKYMNLQLSDVFENSTLGDVSRLFFEPEVFFGFDILPNLNFRNIISRKVAVGDLYDVYPGQLFVNYQTIQVKDAPVPIVKSNRLSLRQSFKDPLISLFINSTFSLSYVNRNTLMISEVQENGLVLLSAIGRENIEKSFFWNGDASKYFSQVRTTLAIGSTYNKIQREIAVNDVFKNLNFSRLNGFVKAVYRKIGKVNFELKQDFSSIRSKTENSFNNESLISTSSFAFILLPSQNHTAKLIFEYLNINSNAGASSSTVSFLDFNYNYKVPNKRIELSLNGSNLLGQKEWATLTNSSFIFVEEFRTLRPRQLTLRLEYSF